jgi:hypothetical protein
MDSRVLKNRYTPPSPQASKGWAVLFLSALGLFLSAMVHGAGFVPPENLNPGQSAQPSLDASYDQEAWLVYTYDIDVDGRVANAKIHISNGVSAVEDKILGHVNAMRFRPATRDGKPVKVFVGPIVYTWILDTPRVMSEQFSEMYQRAWDLFKLEKYDEAFDLAIELKSLSGRNAYEEIKFQILGASLASRFEDDTSELQHLERIVEFQSLADRNRFTNPYVEDGQYLLILERILTLQLGLNMLADGEATLNKMLVRDGQSEVTQRASAAHQHAQRAFSTMPVVKISGELVPIYRDGQGIWENRLFRDRFSLSEVKGRIESVYLACQGGRDMRLRYPARDPWTSPPGWSSCTLEVAGRPGTRFTVQQFTPAPGSNSYP